jgi:putative flavoprotein involved in K+ transport
MKRIDTIIIGAGQAGLAMSYCLQQRSVPHVLLERGEIANSWRTERWDSLRLLTPNWQSRLPGCTNGGPNPDAFMGMEQVVGFLGGYAAAIAAPVQTNTNVTAVSRRGEEYRVATDKGSWACRNLVLASGACNRANVPACAAALPGHITQLSPLHYRNPSQLPAGAVLVVGASATGVQLASEVRAAGHEVTLAAGQHIRMPRHYRGRDIQWWMERSGMLATTTDQIGDIARARAVPSLQLVGDAGAQFLDLNALQQAGVTLVGRLADVRAGEALFSGGLANAATLSDLKMNRALEAFDAWAAEAAVVVGIDVTKAWLDVFVRPDKERFRVENDTAGIQKLRPRGLAISARLVVMEATGRYHRAAHICLQPAGVPVAIIIPYRSRRFADVPGRLAKTDEIDAEGLARFADVMEPAPTEPPSSAMVRITEITVARRQLAQERLMLESRRSQASLFLVKDQINERIALCKRQSKVRVAELLALVRAARKSARRFDIPMSIPGIGPTTAATRLSEVRSWARPTRPKYLPLRAGHP